MSDGSISSTANSSYVPIIAAMLRGLAQIASGFGFTWALTVTGDQFTMAATTAVMLGTLFWSAWQKVAAMRASRQAQVAAAVASAEIGIPVTVTVTPAGMPNIASKVSIAEQIAAPVVPRDVQLSPAPQVAA